MAVDGNVYLVGPMGAGKTTIGRLLADSLQLEFRDVDREIEERSGVDIPWIFDKEGEAGFRERESALLEELAGEQGLLVATGGGAIQRESNRLLMKSSGKVVYLHASIDEQVRRTARDRKRPLLQNGDPRQVLTELMGRREPLYREIADVVAVTDGRSPRAVVQDICRALLP